METAKVHSKSKHKSAKSSGKKLAVNGPRSDDVEPEVQPTTSTSAANVISVVTVDEACNNNNNNTNDSSDRNRKNNIHNVDGDSGDVVKAEAQPQPKQQQQQQPPQPDAIIVTEQTETKRTDDKLQKGILGYMDRQLKVQTILEPPRSPAQRSTRSSRSSQDKSPRRKRSKSESRRRRERKIIAAGEMEVRQANETLMRYLKQCSDFNDASLSGDLEINESVEDRRVQRKTKSQREKKAHYPSRANGMC
jgi:transmembrane protein 237